MSPIASRPKRTEEHSSVGIMSPARRRLFTGDNRSSVLEVPGSEEFDVDPQSLLFSPAYTRESFSELVQDQNIPPPWFLEYKPEDQNCIKQFVKEAILHYGKTAEDFHPDQIVRDLQQKFCLSEVQANEICNFFQPQDHELNFDDCMESYYHIRLLLSVRRIPYRGIAKLPPLQDPQKYTLVLDLDETLVHCCTTMTTNSDVNFALDFNGTKFTVSAKFRPFVQHFLKTVSQWYEITVFTASQKVYADKVIDIMDPRGLIKYRLYREDCTNVCGNYVKDLSVLGRDLKKTIFIDNSPQAFTYQINNSIPIVSWYDDDNDTELKKMTNILQTLKKHNDVTEYIRDTFRIEELVINLPESSF